MIRHIAGWLIALVLAVFVGLWSFAIANERRAPAIALATGAPAAGIAKAGVAFASFAARQAQREGETVSAMERELAAEAYRSEPLSTSALGLLALSMRTDAEAQRRQSLLELAGKLSRRNTLVNNELIQSAAKRNDDRGFFTWLSRLMSTGEGAKKAYGAALADATAKEGAVEALTPILGGGVNWADYYWALVARYPNSLVNAAKLRLAVAGRPWRQTEVKPTDQQILSGLVRIGEFDAARALANGLDSTRSLSRRNSSNLLRNADFSTVPVLAPFDWQLSTSGNLGASIDGTRKEMLISAIGGARGMAAQQLLSLPPGEYSLAWKLATSGPADSDALSAQLECAERGGNSKTFSRILLKSRETQARMIVQNDTCRWYWFSIMVEIPDADPGIDLSLRNLSLAKSTER